MWYAHSYLTALAGSSISAKGVSLNLNPKNRFFVLSGDNGAKALMCDGELIIAHCLDRSKKNMDTTTHSFRAGPCPNLIF